MEPVQIGRDDRCNNRGVSKEQPAAMEPVQIGRDDRHRLRRGDLLGNAAMEPVQIGRDDPRSSKTRLASLPCRNGARPDRTG